MNHEFFSIDKNKSYQSMEKGMRASIPDIIEKILLLRKGHTLKGESIQALKEEGYRLYPLQQRQ